MTKGSRQKNARLVDYLPVIWRNPIFRATGEKSQHLLCNSATLSMCVRVFVLRFYVTFTRAFSHAEVTADFISVSWDH